ncbi:mechanosensitive ion channel family protein [Halobaculum sp. D14]|uniref:mechanosensitive ion channel family protein n=1 Tax=unclassified Halobaculum TaxID=2640896 RepID=UPI003EBEEB27
MLGVSPFGSLAQPAVLAQSAGSTDVAGTLADALGSVSSRIWLALGVLLFGAVLSYLVVVVNRRILVGAGVPGSIEGTAFERTAREFGTSTVAIIAKLSGYFIFLLSVIVALTVVDIAYIAEFWNQATGFLPSLFVAILVLIIGLVVGDKVELLVEERLRSIKLPQASVIPAVAKWSVFFVAALIALGQVNVDVAALIVLLAAYVFALVLFGALAFRDLLACAAAGFYLLLEQPYGIGDRIRIGDTEGVVQEVDVFVTHVETDGKEYVIPNRRAFTNGIVRVRDE